MRKKEAERDENTYQVWRESRKEMTTYLKFSESTRKNRQTLLESVERSEEKKRKQKLKLIRNKRIIENQKLKTY